MEESYYRGHKTYCVKGLWYYSDTNKPVGRGERACGECNKDRTPEGHDPCLGTLPGVMNACCGHGNRPESYVQFKNGVRIAGFTLTTK